MHMQVMMLVHNNVILANYWLNSAVNRVYLYRALEAQHRQNSGINAKDKKS